MMARIAALSGPGRFGQASTTESRPSNAIPIFCEAICEALSEFPNEMGIFCRFKPCSAHQPSLGTDVWRFRAKDGVLRSLGKGGLFRQQFRAPDGRPVWLLIVLSCYFHALGMLVTKKEFENRSKGTDFPQFKTGLLKFEELAFDAPAMARWQEARPQEPDTFRTIRNIPCKPFI